MTYQETSREAYHAFKPHWTQMDATIIEALRDGPLTCDQIEQKTGRKHQAVSGNVTRLVKKGVVVNTGEFGRTSANRRAIIWALADGAQQ